MDEVRSKSVMHGGSPPKKAAQTQLETSERILHVSAPFFALLSSALPSKMPIEA
jgi:hypothetical protein